MTSIRPLSVLALSSVALFSSCSSGPSAPSIGEHVTVQFRRDALGSSHALPISPTVHSMNGASVSLGGELLDLSEDWVVVKEGANTHWISRPNVLLLSQR